MERLIIIVALILTVSLRLAATDTEKPNIILVMSDDQGWGQTGYYNHPVLKTPNLDAMAENGLRLDRFYAGAPVCSPTRATVLTGRSNDRTAVYSHGLPMRRQEKTIAQALKEVGYVTAHFGKWHLNGHRGPGAPIMAGDNRNPGQFGFDEWLSVSNYFDMNPIMSRNGTFEEFQGESSHIIVNEALKYIEKNMDNGKPLFVVIWYGSPHKPWEASDTDKKSFEDLEEATQNHYGELVSMDNSIGNLRNGLREMEIEENTLLWFNSDNGGLKYFGPETVGGLRGFKASMYEGGLRVPAIIEWPAVIKQNRITDYPASTMDIFPTISEVAGIPELSIVTPIDGISIKELFESEILKRNTAIPFRFNGKGALIDNNYKLICLDNEKDKYELYDLNNDPKESKDIVDEHRRIAKQMIKAFKKWNQSVESSIEGKDFEGGLIESDPKFENWYNLPQYEPYIEEWKDRPEYERVLENYNK